MAVHAGECSERNGDYFGPTVNRVARLEAIAHGGQVVLSGRATAMLGDRLPDGVALRDMGEHRLKDLIAPEHVFQLEIDGLPAGLRAPSSGGVPRLLKRSPSRRVPEHDPDQRLWGVLGSSFFSGAAGPASSPGWRRPDSRTARTCRSTWSYSARSSDSPETPRVRKRTSQKG